MVHNRATQGIPTHARRDDFGLSHRRSFVQAIRVTGDDSFPEAGGARQRPGLNSWLTARVMRVRGLKAK